LPLGLQKAEEEVGERNDVLVGKDERSMENLLSNLKQTKRGKKGKQ
jgi:hypothetical protein